MNKAVSEIQAKMKTWTDAGIELAYNSGYEQGCKDQAEKHQADLDYKDGLEDGRMEAWECARKISNMTMDECEKIFGEYRYLATILPNVSASEAIAKIKEHEQKQTDEMSMKDAINWMKDYFRTIDMPMPQYDKAFEMAIKSMEYIDDHAL